MHHSTLIPAATATGGAIRAVMSDSASSVLKALEPFYIAIEAALDRSYGAGRWFVYWDEDLRGLTIRGTITLAYGHETLVIG